MALLHIYDSNDDGIIETVAMRGIVDSCPVSDPGKLVDALNPYLAHYFFDRILFETHGSPGCIYFGEKSISANYWRSLGSVYASLLTPNARIYFNGCNVAEGPLGWAFLEAAAGAFLQKGGEVFGHTSLGYGIPFGQGHVVHLWGKTRRIYVGPSGRITERFEL